MDMGDEQSIENDLSTYSSHLFNMKHFLRQSKGHTLVLIDEFGTGTEPMLGGAIAESVLEQLNLQGVYGVITTHYTNLKHMATQTEGIENGAMLFDTHLIQPLYKLQIAQPGSSFAFEIARKIGLPENILESAKEKIGQEHIDYDKNLREIVRRITSYNVCYTKLLRANTTLFAFIMGNQQAGSRACAASSIKTVEKNVSRNTSCAAPTRVDAMTLDFWMMSVLINRERESASRR